ncbi:hypothetical protein [Pseudobutyrivibrio xylanivorans]|uniref:Uncharacterized protein n=1 Tax=Pseudobutyrivibrio xylanivorans TaxID=185007 RepID=A0A5P6VTW1_PSEXY|nr:hypothetical protein [Pseudobutyrivibrio xylanivorans]QFJ54311.1 hypothetical protein FXF36_05275 [Pseudobutyrivibrio xylanivorans]
MENYKYHLEEQLKELNGLIKLSNKNIAKYKDAPSGHIHLSKCNGSVQYYYIDKTLGIRKYMNIEEIKTVKKLIQRDYDLAVNKKLIDLQMRLSRFLNLYDIDDITGIYSNLIDGRKRLVEPIIETNEMFIERWYEEHPGMQNTYPEEGMYQINRGEMVRSKSEKIIADALDKYGVPYQYEPMLELGYNTVYPDFVVLNVRTRKTIYWEHLGIVSDMEYATKNF